MAAVGPSFAERVEAHVQGSPAVLLLHAPSVDVSAGVASLRRVAGLPVVSVAVDVSSGPAGPPGDGARVLAFPPWARVALRAVPSAARMTYARGQAILASMAQELGRTPAELSPERNALISFVDPGDGGEELIAAALGCAGPGLPLIGAMSAHGSAGRSLALDGDRCGAVVALVDSPLPLYSFLAHPFDVTDTRVVVTASDPAGRLIHEIDGSPAAVRFRELGDLPPDALEGGVCEVLARLPFQLGWRVGGQLVVRAVQGELRGSLRVSGAVEPGTVLRLLRRTSAAARVAAGVRRAIAACPVVPEQVWAMACMGLIRGEDGDRLLDDLDRLGVVTLGSPGQQYGPTHTCQTAVGLVWGSPGGR